MRQLVWLAMAVLVPAAAIHAPVTESASASRASIRSDPVDISTRRALVAARDSVWRAWFAGDSAVLMHLLPPALSAGSKSGWETRDASIASARGFAAGGGKLVELSFDSTSITLRGVVAVLQAKYHYVLATGADRTSRKGTAVEVFVRQDGHWINPFWYLE